MYPRALPLFLTSLLLAPPTPTPPPAAAVPARAADLAGFVPKGWRVLAEGRGDLNGDGLADVAAVFGSAREASAPPDAADLPPRLLLVALAGKGAGGKVAGYRRSALDAGAVFGRGDGGAFGDPLADLRVEHGTVVLEHYGGARERWSYADRFRWQNGAWEQIGHTYTSTDAFEPTRSRTRDVNLNTGRVVESGPPPPDGGAAAGAARRERTYHELSVGPAATAPEWPPREVPLGRTVRLAERGDVVEGAASWRGPGDASATVSGAAHGGSLYLRARVRDDRVGPGDMVRLVDARGRVVPAAQARTRAVAGGYVWQGRYPLAALGARAAETVPARQEGGRAYAPAGVEASVEVWDADGGARPGPRVLSTSRDGRRLAGRVRLTRAAGLPRLGETGGAAFYAD